MEKRKTASSLELNSSKVQGCLDTEFIGSNLCLVLIVGHGKGEASQHSGEGRRRLGWAVGGWRHGAASVGSSFKAYFWPQVTVPVSARDAPKVCCYCQSSFPFPQSCLKASLLQEEDSLC